MSSGTDRLWRRRVTGQYLDVILLYLIDRKGLNYGYAINNFLRYQLKTYLSPSTFYPMLHKLESKGFLESNRSKTSSNRSIVNYLVTPEGKQFLESFLIAYREFVEILKS